jgi:hypothetical protein
MVFTLTWFSPKISAMSNHTQILSCLYSEYFFLIWVVIDLSIHTIFNTIAHKKEYNFILIHISLEHFQIYNEVYIKRSPFRTHNDMWLFNTASFVYYWYICDLTSLIQNILFCLCISFWLLEMKLSR